MTEPSVVVGCDGTPECEPALRFAAEEAALRHVRLLVICAYDQPVDPDLDDFDIPDEQRRARIRTTAEHSLHRVLGSAPGAACEVIAAPGEPGHVLLNYAAGAVLIVIGSHERSVLQRLFARHTSRHLLHDSPVPVTIVPPAAGTLGPGGDPVHVPG